MELKPVHTQTYIKYIPVWVDVSGKTGRGFSKENTEDCESFFAERVKADLNDQSYQIEMVDVTRFVAKTQPNKSLHGSAQASQPAVEQGFAAEQAICTCNRPAQWVGTVGTTCAKCDKSLVG